MSRIILDDCLLYLHEAELCLNNYKEIDSYMEIFEAENPEVKEQMETNEKARTGAIENIKKAINALLDMFKKVLSAIKTFIDKRNMSVDERAAYDEFKKAAKADPSLKDKKINVKDFRAIEARYREELKYIEEQEKAVAAGKTFDAEELANRVKNFTKTAAKAPVTAVSAETAIRMAGTSREIARAMYKKLENDEKFFQKVVDGIGEKEANKLKKDMKSLTHRISLKKAKMKITHTYSQSCDQAVCSMVDDFKAITGIGKKEDTKSKKDDKDSKGEDTTPNTEPKVPNKDDKAPKKDDTKSKKKDSKVPEAAKAILRQQGTLKKMAGNKSLSKMDDVIKFSGKVAGKTIVKSKVEDAKDTIRGKIYDKKYDRVEKKVEKKKAKYEAKGKAVPKKYLSAEHYLKNKAARNQSAIDALLGTNDPDSKLANNEYVKKYKDAAKTVSRIRKVTK